MNLLTRLHAEIVTPFHIFNQAQSKGFLVFAGGCAAGSVLKGSNGLVPLPAALDGITLKIVTPGEAKESLMVLLIFILGACR